MKLQTAITLAIVVALVENGCGGFLNTPDIRVTRRNECGLPQFDDRACEDFVKGLGNSSNPVPKCGRVAKKTEHPMEGPSPRLKMTCEPIAPDTKARWVIKYVPVDNKNCSTYCTCVNPDTHDGCNTTVVWCFNVPGESDDGEKPAVYCVSNYEQFEDD